MKVIYVFERRLPYESDVNSYGYDIFRKNGWEIEVWCMLGWDHNIDFSQLPSEIQLDKGDYVSYINSKNDFVVNVERVKQEDVFFLFYTYHAYNKKSYQMRKILHENKLKFANVTESPGFDECILKKVPFSYEALIRRLFLGDIFSMIVFIKEWVFSGFNGAHARKIIDRFYRYFGPIIYPSYCNFITTELEYYFVPQPFCKWVERNVLIHTSSYTEYIQEERKGYTVDEEYIVFVDQGMVNRDDVFKTMGGNPPIKNANKYLEDLNVLFDRVEKKYNCRVVVAAHPKAAYNGSEFGNRKIIYGKTPQLIKYAKLCIVQFSTAIFLAIKMKKDLLPIYTEEMWYDKSYRKPYKAYSLFSDKILDISKKMDIENFEDYIITYDEEKISRISNTAIIDEKSMFRGKTFYEYVLEYISESAYDVQFRQIYK